MQRFDDYLADRMNDPIFKAFYTKECHVCTNTVRIFAKIERDALSFADVADAVGVKCDALLALRNSDYCEPAMVIRLCRYFDLPVPQDCPRLSGGS